MKSVHPGWLPFVGRESELEILRKMLEKARQGNGSSAVISGEPGIGKSRLALEIEAVAQKHGFIAAVGHSYPGSDMPSAWPWTQVIRQLIVSIPSDDTSESSNTHSGHQSKTITEIGDPDGMDGSDRRSRICAPLSI